MQGIGSGVILIEDQATQSQETFREHYLAFTDHDFLEIFPRPILNGNPNLEVPNSVVLTRSTAMQYFKTIDATGETLILINQFGEHPFQVTGVIEDFPTNSDVSTNVLASISTLGTKEYIGPNTWMNIEDLRATFSLSFFRLENPEVVPKIINYRKKVAVENGIVGNFDVHLQTVADMHLNPGEEAVLPTFGDARLVNFLLLLASLILLIAWINYVNLSTAQALKKARSISVRKVIGASRGHLIKQQIAETILLTLFGVLFALVGCFLLQPFFNYLVDLPLSLSILADWRLFAGVLGFLLTTSLVAGFYVAFILTGYDPSRILKGSFGRSNKGLFVRKTLVTTQFAISIAFIAGTLIMLMQINYIQNKDLGFSTDRRLAIVGPADFSEETFNASQVFQNQLEQLPFVRSFSAAGGVPGVGINNVIHNLSRERDQVDEAMTGYNMIFVDENYFDVLDIEMIAGKAPTPAMVEAFWWNNKKLIINETAARSLGYEDPAAAFQETLYYKYGEELIELEVIGVIGDYHHWSLHAEVAPMVFGPGQNHVGYTLVVEGDDTEQQLSQLEQLYQKNFPKSPFIYQFMDDIMLEFYEADRQLGRLITAGTIFAIFISCLGLLGLIAYSIEQQTKEIGIRKVLGASVVSIVSLLSKGFLKLIGIAVLVATPLAWYVMHHWLQNFAYQINIQWWIFLLAGLSVIAITFLTLGFQSIKAALANPVDSLRNE